MFTSVQLTEKEELQRLKEAGSAGLQGFVLKLDLERKPKVVVVRSDSNSSVCSICLKNVKFMEWASQAEQCKHIFHQSCLNEWMKFKLNCPNCKGSLI